jgi:anti-sigma B factor antagonist
MTRTHSGGAGPAGRHHESPPPTVAIFFDPDNQLEVAVVDHGRRTVTVQASGELDSATSALLDTVLRRSVARGARFVRLDLSRLQFCDAAGLSVLVRLHHELLAGRGTLVLTAVAAGVRKVLRLTALDDVFLIAGSE